VYEWIVVIRPDAERLVQHLGDRRQAVGRARRVGDDVVLGRLVRLEVDAAAQGDVGVLGRGRDEDLARAAGEVLAAALLVDELAGRLDDDVDAGVLPLDRGRVFLGADRHLVAVDDERVAIDGDRAGVAAVHRVVAQEVAERGDVGEVVDEHQVEALGGGRQAAHEAAPDATETVDANANLGHGEPPGRMRAR
jgi:hypothetical protein